MAMQKAPGTNVSDAMRWPIIGGLVAVGFFGAYKFASASNRQATIAQAAVGQTGASGAQATANSTAAANSTGADAATGGCACCGGASQTTADGVTGPRVDGTAKLTAGVQAIAVEVTTVYSPNVIHLKAGVPAEVTFGLAQGCTSQVQSQVLGFAEDLSAGPKVVTIKDPRPGTYEFACGMNMVHGKIVVE